MRWVSLAAGGLALALAGPATGQDLGFHESDYVQVSLGASVGGDGDIRFNAPGLGFGRLESDLDAGLALSALVGRSYTSGVSFELEGLLVDNDVDTDGLEVELGQGFGVRTTTIGGFANVKYEHVNTSPLFPYVAAGVGVGQTAYKVLGDRGDSNGVLWQLKAGVAIPATDALTWDLGYRYMRSPDYESRDQVIIGGQTYEATFKAATDVHALAAGLRWAF